jgi:ATP-dependent Clp protease protease subunit
MALVPFVIESDGRSERGFDIYSRLLRDRIIFLGTEINDEVANLVVAQLLYLEAEGQDKEISIYINSPGGNITAGLAIYDTMQFVSAPVTTICLGQAASMAAVLLAGGRPGRRFSLPSARIILHQPFGGFQGQASDVAIQAKEILRMRETLNRILSTHTGQAIDRIQADIDRDFIMTPDQAKDYGLIDQIISSRKESLS